MSTQIQPSAWEIAHRAGRRVFYEESTQTLRQCPQNYMLAYRNTVMGRWTPDPDKASTINAHSLSIVLEQYRELTGDSLAAQVEVEFWGELSKR